MGSLSARGSVLRDRAPLYRLAAVGAVMVCVSFPSAAQGPNAFTAEENARKKLQATSLREVRRAIIPQAGGASCGASAYQAAYIAELMKLVGDYRADVCYRKAIERAPKDPTYEFAYSRYLRVFRGALEPLFPPAEVHLLRAERKFACLKKENPTALAGFASLLARAFVDLYQRDGFAVVSPSTEGVCPADVRGQVSLFEGFGARAAKSTMDLDRHSLVRDLTAGLMLARSRPPLNRLGAEEPPTFPAAFTSSVTPVAATQRFRLRAGGAPAIDIFVTGQNSGNAQITRFVFDPNQPATVAHNDVKLSQYGVSANRAFTIFNVLDAAAGVTYRRVRRWGVIEYLPRDREDINQVDIHAAASRFIGPDKLTAEFNFANQDISPRIPDGLRRDRTIYSGTVTYQLFRYGSAYSRKFQNTRGVDFSGGIVHDRENYPAPAVSVAAVTRRDYFVATTVRALRGFDFNLRPTVFTSDVSNAPGQRNSQFEIAGYALYRIRDEERTGGLPKTWKGLGLSFIHIAVPFHKDTARSGSAAFENYKIGAELNAKWFGTARRGVNFLGSVRYDFQNFHSIGRTFHLVTGGLSMGF